MRGVVAVDDRDWQRRALCRGRSDVWLSTNPKVQAIAATECLACPVIVECGALAAELEAGLGVNRKVASLPGVWAGRTGHGPLPQTATVAHHGVGGEAGPRREADQIP
jgi:transcription factor WhiB